MPDVLAREIESRRKRQLVATWLFEITCFSVEFFGFFASSRTFRISPRKRRSIVGIRRPDRPLESPSTKPYDFESTRNQHRFWPKAESTERYRFYSNKSISSLLLPVGVDPVMGVTRENRLRRLMGRDRGVQCGRERTCVEGKRISEILNPPPLQKRGHSKI